VFSTGRSEMLRLHQPLRLLLDFRDDFGDGIARPIPGEPGISTKVTHRLKVHSPDTGQSLQGILDDRAKAVGIHAGDQRRDENHPQFVVPALRYGLFFLLTQRPPPERHRDLIVETVKLEKHARKSCFFQSPNIVRLPGQTQAVGVELNEIKAHFPPEGDDCRQIVTNGGFSPRELHVARPRRGQQRFEAPSKLGQVRVPGRLVAGIRVADRAPQVAPVSHFHQGATGLLPVVGT